MKRLDVRGRIWAASAGLALLAFAALGLETRSELRRTRRDTLRRLDTLAAEQALMARDWLADAAVDLQACAALGRVHDPGEVYRIILRRADYVWIQAVDLQGRRRLVVARNGRTPVPPSRAAVAAALSAPAATVSLGWENGAGAPYVDLGVADRNGSARGALFLRLDPRAALFRELRAARAFSASAESHLVRPEDGNVLFFSKLRAPGAPRSLPLSTPGLAAAKAVRGEPLDGTESDYRGRRVLAVARPIRGTDWTLIAKVDDAEVRDPVLAEALELAAALLFLFAALALAAGRYLRRQEAAHELRELASQRALLANTRQLDAFFEHALTPLVLLDPRFQFVRVNDAYAKACGKDVSDFPGRNHFELYPNPETERIFREVVKTKAPYRAIAKAFEYPDHPEWGTTYWDWTLVPILGDGGEAELLLFSLEDVTERVRAQRDLENKARELEELYNGAPCGYHSLGEDGTFLKINDTELRWLGYRREEVVGRLKFADVTTPEGRAAFHEQFPAFKERGWVRDLEFDLVRKDGSTFPVLVSAVAVRDANGRFATSRSTVYDNTERKRAEVERERLAAVVEGSDDAIIGKTLAGVITSWNEGARRLYGWTAQEIVGERSAMLVPADKAHEEEAILERIREGKHVAHYETTRLTKDGRELHVSLAVSPIRDRSGAVIGASSVARDVTKRWKAERAVERLTRGMRTLSRCNEALVRAKSEKELLDRICALLIEEGGYKISWVGYRVDDADKTVRPVARAGTDSGYIDRANVTWADVERGRGPTGIAIREARTFVCRDVENDPRFKPWREDALRRGFRSSIGLPLVSNGRPFGALMLYAGDPGAFNDDEVRLLEELAADLAFGVSSLRARAAREAAEEALRHASAYNRSLIEASLDPLVTIGPDGRITDVNRATENATGRTRRELIGSDFSDYFTDPATAKAGYERVFRDGFVRDYPLELSADDGTVRSVVYNASVYRDERGDVIGVFAAARDVTQAKAAEAALRRANRELHAISECNQTLMRATDEKTLLDEVCRIVCEKAGYRMAWVGYAEKDPGKTVRPAAWGGTEDGYIRKANVTWSDEPRGRGPMGTAIREGRTACVQDFAADPRMAPWRQDALERGYRSIIALPLKDPAGETFGGLCIYAAQANVFDDGEVRMLEELAGDLAYGITALRLRAEAARAQDALRASEAKYRAIFEESLDGLFVSSPDGRFLDLNRKLVEMFGYESKREMLALDLARDFYADPADGDRVRAAVGKSGSAELELPLKKRDGSRISALLEVTVEKDALGAVTRYRGIVRDESERKKLQDQMYHAQRMESVGVLAGGVAHDFNNILMTILANCSFLLDALGPQDPRRSDVEEIKAAGERAAALTRQLLIFSRKQTVQPVVVDLNALVRNLQKMLVRVIGEDIQLKTELASEALPILVDPGQLEQVVMNLTVNARDAMTHGGTLTIATGRPPAGEKCHADCETAGTGQCARLEIRDTGTGMPPEVLKHLFEPFFTTKPVGKGTGLGLSTVYGIVRQAGGGVGVRSDVGKGTTFVVDFPIASEEAAPEPAAAAAPGSASGGEKILLVEDDEMLRRIDIRLLEERGYRVVAARDGEEALRLLQDGGKDADLLLTDVVMPGISGADLAREALKLRPALPVIFVSGYTEHSELEKVQGGKYELLQKPIKPDQLARKVREVLDRKRG